MPKIELRKAVPTEAPPVEVVAPTDNAPEAAKPVAEAVTPATPPPVPATPAPTHLAPQSVVDSALVAASAAAATAPLARPQDVAPNDGFEGDFEPGDMKLPRLQIVQGSGELIKQYDSGTVLLNNEVLFKPTPTGETPPTIRFVLLHLKKQFAEVMEKDSDDMPRIVNSLVEVEALGSRVGYEVGEFKSTAQVFMLIERPAGAENHPSFTVEVDGKAYAPSIYFAKGTAYSELARPLFSAGRSGQMRDENGNTLISSRICTMQIKKTQRGAFTVIAPFGKVTTEKTSAALREAAAMFFPATTATDAAAE